MDADERGSVERTAHSVSCRSADTQLTGSVIGAFYSVYNELGTGFLESVYRRSMEIAVEERGLAVRDDCELPVYFRGRQVGFFRPDLVVENSLILEIKASGSIIPAHQAQLLNYLRASTFELGFLLNFGPKPSFERLAFANARKRDHGSFPE